MLSVEGFPKGSLPCNLANLELITERWAENTTKPQAAVGLVFLPPEAGQTAASVILTRRTVTVRSHKGQISLPGGRVEDLDENVVATAAREIEEEIGIPTSALTPIGCLQPIRALDESIVYPVVMASLYKSSQLRPATDEVAEIILEPWTSFQRLAAEHFRFNIFGQWRQSFLFRGREAQVWGLTAAILYNADLS